MSRTPPPLLWLSLPVEDALGCQRLREQQQKLLEAPPSVYASLQGLPVAKELWGKFVFLWQQALHPERMDRDPASTHTEDWWI